MFKTASILACLLALLVGCTAPARRGAVKTRPPDWSLAGEEKSHLAPLPAAPTPVPPPRIAPGPETTWVSLNRWGQQRGFGTIRRLSPGPVESYALFTPRGALIVSVGSLAAFWDGLELWLGFAPQLIGDELFLHALDVKKNLEPLLASFGPFANSPPVVILDPGHGGANTGARSVANGQFEKEFTLDWARRLVSLLERKGWRVFLTRTNDADMTLAERVAFADQHNAALFLSLHFNSVDTANNQTGIETYCLTPAGMSSNLTRGYDDDVARVFPNNAFDAQNLQWAMRLHRALLAVNGGADRGVRRARFLGVLRGQNRPAVLLEGGYLSNPNETRLIADPAYRQKLAEAVATALE